MLIAVKLSDGHGNDYADGCGATWAICDLVGVRVQELVAECNKLVGLFPTFDEARILLDFDAYNDSLLYDDEGEYRADWAEVLERHGFVLLPEDWKPTEDMHSGQVECCALAAEPKGVLQLHCLPKGLDGWLRSSPFYLKDLPPAALL